MRTGLALVACLAAGTLATSAFAATALTFTSFSPNGTATASTRGYTFDVLAEGGVTVSALSFFDENGDGLGDSHDIGIWNAAGALLASATVPSGTAAPLDETGMFRMVDIPDIVLPLGTGYRVGATFLVGSPDHQAETSSPTTIPEIAYIGGAFVNNGLPDLTFPSTDFSQTLVGGNFSATVPEPASLGLIGAVGLLLLRRSR